MKKALSGMNKQKYNLKGFSLAEIILAIGIFSAMTSMLVFLVVDSTRTLENIYRRNKATQLTSEVYNALLILKQESWYNIAQHTGEGSKHIEFNSNSYQILDGEDTKDGMTYFFTIETVMRNSSREIVTEGGTIDPHSRIISITVNWTDRLNQIQSINPKIYVNDWNTHSIIYTSKEDFDTGSYTDTMSEIIEDGEVRLLSMKYADWCNPTLSMSSFDLPGQGIAKTISTNGEIIYMGTGDNASGISFMDATVAGEPPIVTNGLDTFDGYKTNDVFGINGTVLLATDTNNEEIVIVDISSVPYTKIGYFDSSGPQDATSVYAVNDIGFVAHANNLTLFDLTSKTGLRPQLRTTTVGTSNSLVTDMFVDDNYVYLTVTNNTYEFLIYSYSPTLQLVGQGDIGSMAPMALFISQDTNRAYIGTATNTGKEFFVLDTTTKDTTYTTIASFELGLLSVTSVVAVENRAIVGGSGGQEYVVLDIENETVPIQCGGIEIETGINAMALATQGINVYTYILTGDSSQELKIIRGGPGGGGPDGNGYLESGEYLSEIYDSTSSTSEYYMLSLSTEIPSGTSLQVQVRVSDSSSMSGATWIGPDGTSSTYFSTTGTYNFPAFLIGRYFQYRVILRSDTVLTPLLKEIVINYEK